MALHPPPQDLTDSREVHKVFQYTSGATLGVQIAVHQFCQQEMPFDVQQLAYRLLSTSGPTRLPSIARVHEEAPCAPNVATDGSLPHPGSSLSYASFRSWEWGRVLAQITPEELEFCRPVQISNERRNGGILLAGTLQGVYSSSTRAELGGTISALAKPIGLHIALDNRGVVDRANSIINGTFKTRKPWALLDDGDLWQAFSDAVQARGASSVAIS